jgi:succinoglycan biosynthesis transport protein ExoP
MSLQQFLRILRARYLVVVLTLLATVSVTVAASLLMPAQYKASAAVVVDVKSPDPVAGMVLPGLAMPGYMATQVDIINSDRVARKVVKLLGLNQNPKVIEDWRTATEGKGTIDTWLADLLQRKLDVKPSRESNVINIGFKATDPAFAAGIANAFAQAYIETNIELKVEPARQYAGWFESRSLELRDALEKAQKRLSDYQLEHGIIATDERLDSENQKLADLQAQLVITQTQNADSTSKRASAGGDTLPEVMQSGVIQQLKSDIARAEGRLKDLSGRLGLNHPQYQGAESELATLKTKLAEETARVSSAISTAGRISKGKENEIRANIDAVKKRILELKQGHGEALLLRQEVENAQRAYDAITQRSNQSTLESQSQQTNVAVLSPATEPTEPSSPKILLNTLLAIFLGTLLGVGAALALELSNRCVRSRADIEQVLGLPVLAELRSK